MFKLLDVITIILFVVLLFWYIFNSILSDAI
jgi:hypothetical protein